MLYMLYAKAKNSIVDGNIAIDLWTSPQHRIGLFVEMKIGAHPSEGLDGQDTNGKSWFQTPKYIATLRKSSHHLKLMRCMCAKGGYLLLFESFQLFYTSHERNWRVACKAILLF